VTSSDLRSLIEAPVAGFWGQPSQGIASRVACRVVRNGDVGKDGHIVVGELSVRWFTPRECAKAEVKHTDAILVSSGAYTGNVGRVLPADDGLPVVASNFVRRLRPASGVSPGWLFHLLRSNEVQRYVWPHSGGSAIPNLGGSFYKGAHVGFVPSHAGQVRIAAVLDTLDDAIRRTEDIIAKLKRIRQGPLRDLLTQGVDENGEIRSSPDDAPHLYKDSPIGRMPRSWDCSLLDDVFDVQPGLTLGPHRVPRQSPFPYLRVANVFRGRLDLSDVAYLNARPSEVPHMLLGAGDLLLVEGHANIEEIGRVALADERVVGLTYQNHLFRLRPHVLEPGFCEMWMNGPWVKSYWRRMCSTSSGLNTINQHTLKAIPIPVPPREERRRIVAAARACSSRIATEQDVLAKHRNLKAALMADLLSGRVRVPLTPEAVA